MNSRLIITFLLVFFCSFICMADDWSDYQAKIYPIPDTKYCKFPFEYGDQTYNNCTTDGDNGDIPWCSLTREYKNLITYCVNFQNTTLQCLPKFTMPDGKVYNQCDYIFPNAKFKQCRTNHPIIRYRYCVDAVATLVNKSVARNDNCDPTYANLSYDHTMCYGPSPYARNATLNSTEIADLLAIHNQIRSETKARYMFKLYWDDELAKLAQAHANLCVFEHDLAENRRSPKFNWTNGQNLAMTDDIDASPSVYFKKMLQEERKNFRYGDTCDPVENSCLHYTQAMLSNLTRVGCAQTHCVYPDRIERYITCNYIHSQYEDNYQTPYVQTNDPNDAGIDCGSKKDSNGLCDCQGKEKLCKYDQGEYLEPSTCQCRNSPTSRRRRNAADTVDSLLNGGRKNLFIRPGAHLNKKKSKRDANIKKVRVDKRSADNTNERHNLYIRPGPHLDKKKDKRDTNIKKVYVDKRSADNGDNTDNMLMKFGSESNSDKRPMNIKKVHLDKRDTPMNIKKVYLDKRDTPVNIKKVYLDKRDTPMNIKKVYVDKRSAHKKIKV